MSDHLPVHSDRPLDFRQRVQRWLKGDAAACDFIERLFDAAHVWDDLIDRDRSLPTEAVHQAFWDLLIAIPGNRFYVQHYSLLNGLLQQAILNWHIANNMEAEGDERDLHIAFILRSSYADLITASAWILGGEKWAIQVGHEVRCETSREGYAVYCERLRAEHRTPVTENGGR